MEKDGIVCLYNSVERKTETDKPSTKSMGGAFIIEPWGGADM